MHDSCDSYDLNGIDVCDCYSCELEWREQERAEKIEKLQRGVDWSQFPMEITTKAKSKCPDCDAPHPVGSRVMWYGPGTAKIRCLEGKCRPRGWQKYDETCPFCDEPYTGELGGYDHDGDYTAKQGEYGCGSTIESGPRHLSERAHRSSGCQTIQRLKKRLTGEKPSDMYNINDLL